MIGLQTHSETLDATGYAPSSLPSDETTVETTSVAAKGRKMSKSRVDPSKAKITIEVATEPNPRNPYSTMTPEQRNAAMVGLIRQIKLRKVDGATDIETT